MLILRSLAAVLAVLGVVPLWRLLVTRPTGLAGASTAAQASGHSSLLWSALLLCAVPALLAVVLLERDALEQLAQRMTNPLRRGTARAHALILGLLATLLAALVALFILGGVPTLIDSFAQLVHARYLADGAWSGPVTANQEFWHIQQTVLTQHGWVSQYPPGHVVLLAIGLKLGAVWLIGPLCWGIAVFFMTLALHELIADVVLARAAAWLAAVSPFSVALAGAYMSHIPAAACAAAALYCAARARRGAVWFAVAAGVALGVLFTIRPLTAAALAVVAVAMHWRRPLHVTGGLAGALPFIIAIAIYNRHFFGSALRFGYQAALGPSAGLGFGTDPWGNQYGIVEAIAYTAAELASLSVFLFETPLPFVLLIGLYFLFHKPAAGAWVLFAWAAAPVIANLFYWHHGLFMGPRMLADVGIMWAALAIIAVVELIRGLRADWLIAGKYSPRSFATAGAMAAAVFGVIMLLPQRMASHRTDEVRALLAAPAIAEPALVFMHGGWTARLGMRLAAHGMRLDSVETALTHNPTCRVHAFAEGFTSSGKSSVLLDFNKRATNLPPVAEISPGNRIRVLPNERLDADCSAQVGADQAGVIDVTPYIWQGDLPGGKAEGPMFVRDMGPAANRKLISDHTGRRALMLLPDADSVRVVPYPIAERVIWGVTP